MLPVSAINPEPHCIGAINSKIFVHARPSAGKIQVRHAGQGRDELQPLASEVVRGNLGEIFVHSTRGEEKTNGSAEILI
jgi:hypothetical protein